MTDVGVDEPVRLAHGSLPQRLGAEAELVEIDARGVAQATPGTTIASTDNAATSVAAVTRARLSTPWLRARRRDRRSRRVSVLA